MEEVCRQFAKGQPASSTAGLVSNPIEQQLKDVARAFVAAQQARHEADYDTSKQMIRLDVLNNIAAVEQAFMDWKAIRNTPNAKIFLAALLLQRHWGR